MQMIISIHLAHKTRCQSALRFHLLSSDDLLCTKGTVQNLQSTGPNRTNIRRLLRSLM